MISGINAALSGATAHQRKVDTAAHNLANVSTDGFQKSRVEMQEQSGGVRASSQQVTTPGPQRPHPTDPGAPPVAGSNVDLGEEMVALISGERGFEANLKTLETQDQMLGTLLDMVG